MGLKGLAVISRELQAHGMPGDTPAALVQQGTTHKQRVFTGTVATLPEIVARERPKPPTLIMIGEVVRLQERLAWYAAPDSGEQGATSPVTPGTELDQPYSPHRVAE
jgi:uroporphyrin-III C-methyltransferase/precorrin-2 dehydrogenase/sirohydrochlorin ferrochelatase